MASNGSRDRRTSRSTTFKEERRNERKSNRASLPSPPLPHHFSVDHEKEKPPVASATLNSIGTITQIDANCGVINDEVFFPVLVCRGELPRLGDRVLFEAHAGSTSLRRQCSWIATRIQVMNPRHQSERSRSRGANRDNESRQRRRRSPMTVNDRQRDWEEEQRGSNRHEQQHHCNDEMEQRQRSDERFRVNEMDGEQQIFENRQWGDFNLDVCQQQWNDAARSDNRSTMPHERQQQNWQQNPDNNWTPQYQTRDSREVGLFQNNMQQLNEPVRWDQNDSFRIQNDQEMLLGQNNHWMRGDMNDNLQQFDNYNRNHVMQHEQSDQRPNFDLGQRWQTHDDNRHDEMPLEYNQNDGRSHNNNNNNRFNKEENRDWQLQNQEKPNMTFQNEHPVFEDHLSNRFNRKDNIGVNECHSNNRLDRQEDIMYKNEEWGQQAEERISLSTIIEAAKIANAVIQSQRLRKTLNIDMQKKLNQEKIVQEKATGLDQGIKNKIPKYQHYQRAIFMLARIRQNKVDGTIHPKDGTDQIRFQKIVDEYRASKTTSASEQNQSSEVSNNISKTWTNPNLLQSTTKPQIKDNPSADKPKYKWVAPTTARTTLLPTPSTGAQLPAQVPNSQGMANHPAQTKPQPKNPIPTIRQESTQISNSKVNAGLMRNNFAPKSSTDRRQNQPQITNSLDYLRQSMGVGPLTSCQIPPPVSTSFSTRINKTSQLKPTTNKTTLQKKPTNCPKPLQRANKPGISKPSTTVLNEDTEMPEPPPPPIISEQSSIKTATPARPKQLQAPPPPTIGQQCPPIIDLTESNQKTVNDNRSQQVAVVSEPPKLSKQEKRKLKLDSTCIIFDQSNSKGFIAAQYKDAFPMHFKTALVKANLISLLKNAKMNKQQHVLTVILTSPNAIKLMQRFVAKDYRAPWPSARLHLMTDDQLTFVRCFIPIPGGRYKPRAALKRLQMHNRQLRIHLWKMVYSQHSRRGINLTVGVDAQSLEALVKAKGRMHYFNKFAIFKMGGQQIGLNATDLRHAGDLQYESGDDDNVCYYDYEKDNSDDDDDNDFAEDACE